MDPYSHKMTSDPQKEKEETKHIVCLHYRRYYITLYTDDTERDLNNRMSLSSWTLIHCGVLTKVGFEPTNMLI